ncbi:sal-like protein 3 isoform X1 [Macrosteles quadrilineatus]|uniref:sal-like protein 3 isoform X1 n=1 Tax=Macrosteles quadrilineatus TaxID=74068 RepID=UPI0023E1B097|nr:sal-like protein 3 isoform X1 [Macrosteles quadrilineatus]
MSRRKQARPIRVFESEDGLETEAPQNGDGPITDSEEEATSPRDDNVCDNCNAEFSNVQEAEDHRKECIPPKDVEVLDSPGSGENDEMPLSGDEEDEESSLPEEGKRQEEVRRQKQDAENNNSVEDGETEGEGEDLPLGFPFQLPAAAAAGHVTLEALQNTKVAVAQFAATAMANNTDNAAALQELAVLQSTLYTLQTQQMMQLNLIQQLQQQLQITRPKDGSPTPPLPLTITPRPSHSPLPPSLPKPSRTPTPVKQEIPMAITTPTTQSVPASAPQATTPTSAPKPVTASPPIHTPSLPPCSISSSFASSIITNLDPPPSPSEPNTLEMLQRRAQEVLDNASQGLLANNLADELAFRKNGGKSMSPYDSKTGGRNEPFFKHRCRYCGKVFGSDSALQIHIRSHTGERPFKCNVCGSRFTTKGNLKVHFQRHTSKFPHIKMNPNPVPEHLDKYHPPLLAQMGAHQSLPPGVPAHHPHNSQPPHHHQFPGSPPFPPTGLPMFRPQHDLVIQPHHQSLIKPVLPIPLFGPRQDLHQEAPENLSKPVLSTHSTSPPPSESSDHFKKEMSDDDGPIPLTMCTTETTEEPVKSDERLTPKTEAEGEMEQEQERYSPMGYDECSSDSKYSHEDMLGTRESPEEKHDDSLQDQPENLSNKSTSVIGHFSFSTDQRFPSFSFPSLTHSPPSSTSSGLHTPLGFNSNPVDIDPSKDPALYTSLLPRPGSNDNSWESLIEVTKTSETSKLQQLVDNIEHKLTDPNQCIICHRVLSCKSALQMHYRTHTGERPFRCKICGRAFTTKGNLKTHMGVHRIKPPMRVLHQCPVCHKKFTNGLVLQQHIRLHTGEPTDLTPEQIQAAEIREYLPPSMLPLDSQPFLPLPHPPDDRRVCGPPVKDEPPSEFSEKVQTSSSSPLLGSPSFSTSLAALENQVRTITTVASQYSQSHVNQNEELCNNTSFTPITVNGEKSPPGSSPSGSEGQLTPSPQTHLHSHLLPRPTQRPPSPAASESGSLGALDLTPRTSTGVFSGFGLLPTSALSSLTSSVLTSTAFSPMGLAVGPAVRGNTTCNICFKTFACNSALEIHYRSHTKERPFKCTICDRGFSTKGNMKQHMLTHKIRDMPSHLFEQKSPTDDTSNASSESRDIGCVRALEAPQTPTQPPVGPPLTPTGPPPPKEPNLQQQLQLYQSPQHHQHQHHQQHQQHQHQHHQPPPPPQPVKRSPEESILPLPKRQPSLPKHLCHVCNKNFSSSSALQIHMRTHTGDKPFRCTICHKAFTTKGNLKVHMGTHMWTNGASRRGRRMSLDLPPLPITPKDSDFLHRRPDLFYPYLPAPFLNGMQQKLNEISVIQNVGSNMSNGLLGFGGYRALEMKPGSPGSEKQPLGSPQHRSTPPLWDLHYDRKPPTAPDSPPAHVPPPRGEGLAA